MTRRRRIIILGMLAVVTLLLAAPFIALHSETVTRWVLPEIARLAPGKLSFTHQGGTLAGPLQLADLRWQDGDRRIDIDSLSVDWSPGNLFAGEVYIDYIETGHIDVQWPAADEPQEPPEPFDPADIINALRLPVALQVQRLEIDTLQFADASDSVAIQASGLQLDGDVIAVDTLTADAVSNDMTGTLQLQARLELEPPYAALLSLDIRARKPGTLADPVDINLAADGSLLELPFTLQMQQPMQATLDGVLNDILEDIHWQATLDLPPTDPRALFEESPIEQVELHWQLAGNPSSTRITGTTSLQAEDITAHISPEVDITPTGLRSRATEIQLSRFDTRALVEGTLDWKDSVTFDSTIELQQLRVPLGDAVNDEGSAAANDTTLRFDGSRLAVQGTPDRVAFQLDGVMNDGELDADGSFESNSGSIDVAMNWNKLVLPAGERKLHMPEGSGRLDGVADDYRFSINTGFEISQLDDTLPAGRIALQGNGSKQRIDAVLERLDALNGTSRGTAGFDIESRKLDWSFVAEGIEPGMLVDHTPTGIRGSVDLVASGTSILDGSNQHSVTLNSLGGSLNDNALRGSGGLQLAGKDWSADDIDIKVGDAQLALNGDTSTASGLNVTLLAEEMRDLDPRFAGSLDAKANWRRNGNDTHALRIDATGKRLHFDTASAGSAELHFDLNAAGNEPSTFRLVLDDARIAGNSIDAARVDASGTRAANRIEASVQVTDGQLQLSGEGQWQDDRWSGQLQDMQVGLSNAGAWSLQQPANLAISMRSIDVERFCLAQSPAELCAEAQWQPDTWNGNAQLANADLSQFDGLLPAGLDYRGGIDIQASVSNQPELQAEFLLTLDSGNVLQASTESDAAIDSFDLLAWQSGKVDLRLADRRWQTSLALDLGASGRIDGGGSISLPQSASGASRLDLDFNAQLDRLDMLATLYPEFNRIDGVVSADLAISGTTDSPQIRGNAKLADGKLQLVRYGLQLDDIQLELQGRGRNVKLLGSMRSGDGKLRTQVDLSEENGRLQANGSLNGANFLVSNTRELKLQLSPDMQLESDGRNINITGELHVPMASIRPRELSGTVSTSDDQVFVDAEAQQAEKQERIEVSARVQTILGDNVRFDGFGLTAGIGGALTVIREPQSPARGEGRLALSNGRYLAYGQRLEIERGEVIYTGQPLTEPGLDIRAVRRPAPDITVGVNLRGSLRRPDLSLFSEPAMPEQQQLAWLILGRPATGGSDRQQMDSASLALGLGGGALTSRLREELDLEEATLQDLDDETQASLVLGKYLSPDLYVSYGIGLFDAANTFRVRYQLSSKWALEAVNGLDSSADFLYTIETD